jgi:hypothetical protein
MSAPPRLTTYRFRVAMGSADDPRHHVVLALGRDVQQAEALFAQRGWGKTESRPMTSAAAVAWAAMVRMGFFTGDFDSFEKQYLEVAPEELVTANPTEAEAAPA